MGVYSNNDSGVFAEDAIVAIESTIDSPIAAVFNIVAEGEANYNKIMQAVGIGELAVLESTGHEMVYEAADIKGFCTKVKEYFMNILAKIKGVFQKFMAMLNSWAASDKDFVKKYTKILTQVDTKGFEYQGYKFANLNTDVASVENKAEKTVESKVGSSFGNVDTTKWSESTSEKSSILEAARGSMIGSRDIEAGDFAKELFKFFRSGEDTKQTIDSVDVSKVLSTINGAGEAKKAAEESYKKTSKVIQEFIKAMDKLENKLVKEIPSNDSEGTAATGLREATAQSGYMKDLGSMTAIFNGAQLSAIRDQNRQAKSVCVKLLSYKPKHESAFIHTEGTSFLNNVVFQ